jgi:hypothetical protein
MKAIDAVRNALSSGDNGIRHIEDMRNSPVTAPSRNGENHPLWILGHLAIAEERLRQIVLGEPNPVQD